MSRIAPLALAAAVTAGFASSASAAVIVSENFESYADSAALVAAWPGNTAATLGVDVGSVTGKSATHPGGTVNARAITAISPNATDNIHLRGQIYDDGTSVNKRITIGLRAAAGANLIEMGMFNAPAHYAVRVALFTGTSPNWVAFPNPAGGVFGTAIQGWHTFDALITATGATFTLDLQSDGIIDSTYTATGFSPTAAGFDSLRFGGPSNLASAGGGASFDNLLLETVPVPEPTTLGVLALGGLLLGRRRRD
jgi:hypothetical protein